MEATGCLPVLVLPNPEPFNQILGALKFGMETIFLALKPRHVLHCHAEKDQRTHSSSVKAEEERKNSPV